MTRTLKTLLSAALIGAALATALTLPASAELRTVTVRMADGSLQSVVLDVPPGTTLEGMAGLVEGEPISYSVIEEPPAPPPEPAPAPEPAPEAAPAPPAPPAAPPAAPAPPAPTTPLPPPPAPTVLPEEKDLGKDAPPVDNTLTEPSDKPAKKPERLTLEQPQSKSRLEGERRDKAKVEPQAPELRRPDGSPSPSNPGFVDALPGPSFATGVPNFVIRKFRVPIFLLPIYQAAGIEYGVRWEVLAAINEIETDYGRNLNISSAGALGWMQFMPSSWEAYGVDANKDGKKDPFNPVDAIFAAANYLNASGGEKDLRKAIFAYNHADWYVDSVLLRAKLLSGVPSDVVGSLTGLTEGRFPVGARARYADDIDEKRATRRLKPGRNANNVVNDNPARDGLAIYSDRGAPVVAVNDGRIDRIGHTRKHGHYVVMRDVYGNEYTYAGLGKVADVYPVPKKNPGPSGNEAKAVSANDSTGPKVITKPRTFAHPSRGRSKAAGGLEQMFDARARSGGDFQTYGHVFTPGLGLNSRNATLRELKKGSRVIGGTVLGRVGRPDSKKAAHMNFMIRPAGKGAPRIDPKPILDGWKLLESTAIYRAKGKNVLKDSSNASIGQILMMPKPLLERRVLNDERIVLSAGNRQDVKTGQINRRVLAVLAYLAESGLRPTVSSLKSDHGTYTKSGSVSHHSSGNAVDIAAINGISIIGHQERGGVTHQAVKRLMALQGTMKPAQIISLLDLGGNTVAMGDHNDHIHVGFRPTAGEDRKTGRAALAVLDPEQWTDLIERLGEIENPIVPTEPSRYALPAKPKHRGHGD